ncbi:thioredoxin family protein [Mucilaginibacter sp.]|uniref:thioredoxin family protein n=1 Tax=Mucilaginibacter sp. TaxID=1882438 RepID=UPI003D0FDFFA
MKAKHLIFGLFLLVSSATMAQTAMPSSESVLTDAFAKATKENKKVILIFHASWCGWCKKMDASLNDPALKKMFDDNYVITHLDVMEQKEKAALENPGSMAVMKKLGGENSGLPYWLVLDAKGNIIANSLMPKDGATTGTAADNIGCPATEKEVSYFEGIIKKTSALTDGDLGAIHKRFLLNQPPPQPAKAASSK